MARCAALAVAAVLISCGGGDNGTPQAPAGPGGGSQPPGDFITISVDGAAPMGITEASGLPDIDCDPRVDWGSYQVVTWRDFNGGGGPNGYDFFLDIMLPLVDTVGVYTVHDDLCQALFYDNATNYAASPLQPTSDGIVTVTRSDTRIEGTFSLVVVDGTGGSPVTLNGSFGVDAGFSIVCP